MSTGTLFFKQAWAEKVIRDYKHADKIISQCHPQSSHGYFLSDLFVAAVEKKLRKQYYELTEHGKEEARLFFWKCAHNWMESKK